MYLVLRQMAEEAGGAKTQGRQAHAQVREGQEAKRPRQVGGRVRQAGRHQSEGVLIRCPS